MCVPAAAVAIAGLVLTGIGGYYQGKAEEGAAKYSAAVDRNNATLKDAQADQAARIGAVEEERHRQKVKLAIGTQRAALAANGLDLSDGTALDLQAETAAMGEEDALTIRYNSAREVWGLRTEAQGLRDSAKFKVAAGKARRNATFMTTGANLLGGTYNLMKGA